MTTTATLPVEAAATATSTSSAERLRGILARVAPSVLVAIPVALAMAIAHLVWTPPSFRSEALLWIEVRDGASDETALGMLRSRRIAHRVLARDLIDENASAGALSNVLARAASFRWLPGWLHLALPPKHPADLYGEQLRVQRQAESDLVAVRFTSGDPDNAAAVANAHVDAFLAYLTELGEAAPARARLIDEAIPPLARSSPKLASTLLSAVAIGLIGGLALAVWRRGLDQRLRSAEDVENQLGLPLLGVVPDMISLARWALAQANSRRLT
jgi:capsular polysaccharide biosynthesis protein